MRQVNIKYYIENLISGYILIIIVIIMIGIWMYKIGKTEKIKEYIKGRIE